MTVTTSTSRIPYTGDGTSTAFAFPYYFLSAADLKVYVNGAQVTTGITVTGAGNSSGGNVSISPAPGVGASILILRDPDSLQNTKLPPNDPFPSSAVESMSDKLTMPIQRIMDRLTRALLIPDTDSSSPGTLPNALARAGKLLGFDANGTSIMYPVTASVGAGNLTSEGPFVAGTHFTPGTSSTLTLSQSYGTVSNVSVHFDG